MSRVFGIFGVKDKKYILRSGRSGAVYGPGSDQANTLIFIFINQNSDPFSTLKRHFGPSKSIFKPAMWFWGTLKRKSWCQATVIRYFFGLFRLFGLSG